MGNPAQAEPVSATKIQANVSISKHKLPKCPKTMGQKNNFQVPSVSPSPVLPGPAPPSGNIPSTIKTTRTMESSTHIEDVLQLKDEHLPAKTIMLRPGETARRIYYIKKGFIRSFFIDSEGREHTTGFSGSNQLITSTASFLLQQPSDGYLQSLSDCELLSLSYHQLQSYYADFPQGNLIGRILVERHFAQAEMRSRLLRYKSPRQRYQQLIAQHPNIEQLTTTGYIASYLGINRETLSRTRSGLLRGTGHC